MKPPRARDDLITLVQLDVAAAPQAPAQTLPADGLGPGMQVTLHFALELESGAVVDSCYDKAPARFTVGDGSLLPHFETALYGMKAGETRELLLPPARAFGEPSEGNVQRFPRFRFPPDLALEPGLMVDFADANGNSQAGVVRCCSSQWVEVDFNHPLAGKTIRFRATIISLDPPATAQAPDQEIEA
jgi:FKBP-type peptidyl-prolyl cis-trans isomerase SlpA